MQQDKPGRNKFEDKSSWLGVGSLGFTLVIATAIGFFAGYFLDRWLNTSPLFLIVLLLVGIVAGFLAVFREVMPNRKK